MSLSKYSTQPKFEYLIDSNFDLLDFRLKLELYGCEFPENWRLYDRFTLFGAGVKFCLTNGLLRFNKYSQFVRHTKPAYYNTLRMDYSNDVFGIAGVLTIDFGSLLIHFEKLMETTVIGKDDKRAALFKLQLLQTYISDKICSVDLAAGETIKYFSPSERKNVINFWCGKIQYVVEINIGNIKEFINAEYDDINIILGITEKGMLRGSVSYIFENFLIINNIIKGINDNINSLMEESKRLDYERSKNINDLNDKYKKESTAVSSKITSAKNEYSKIITKLQNAIEQDKTCSDK